MFVIKMLRTGRRNRAFFRIISSDKKGKLNANTEFLGHLCPIKKDFSFDLNRGKVLIQNGAKISKSLFYRMKSLRNHEVISEEYNEFLNEKNIA